MAETQAGKRTSIKKVDAEKLAQGIYSALFTDGTTFEANLADVKAEMVARFTQYGLKQKLDDSMAGAETIEDALTEVKSTWEAIVAGNWTIRVAGEGVEGGLFARAYAQVHNISLADAKAKIGGLVEKNLAANRAKNAGKPNAPEITERMVFNSIRTVALERNPDLKVAYDDLKAKKEASKTTKSGLEIELE